MLTGTLDDFTLPDVLRLIAGARRSGGLAVTRDGGAGSLYFRDGTVSGGVARYTRRTEATAPARAVEDLVFDLMRWDRGDFTWTADEAGPSGAEASVDVDDLLDEVSRRLAELAEIQTLVPSEAAVLTMAPQPPEGAAQINITPQEWRVLVLVDGHRTVAEVAEAAHLDDLEAMKLLYGLAAAGLVAAGPRPESPSALPQEVSDMSDMSDTTPEDTLAALDQAPEVPDTLPEDTFAVVDDAPSLEGVSDMTDMTAVSAVSDAAPETHSWVQPEPSRRYDPEPDPFLAELSTEPVSPFDGVLAPEEPHVAPAVDRSTAARELAGLFDDVDPTQALGGMSLAGPPAPPKIRRVEDDDQVTRGLISRLIDGVKGL